MIKLAHGVVHKIPDDLRKVLISDPKALLAWEDITPLARNEWICWIESVKKAKERPFALNQKPDEEYEKLWSNLEKKTYRSVRSPYEVYAFGRQMIAA